jgi:hypothetical protein
VKALALVAWLPVAAGAILSTFGQTAWDGIGVVLWAVGVGIQFATLLVLLRAFRSRRLQEEHRAV